MIGQLVKRTKSNWDDIFFRHGVFNILAHLAPALVIHNSAQFAAADLPWMPAIVLGITKIYLIIIFLTLISRFLNAAFEIYNAYDFAKDRPIKGYIQLLKILAYFIGGMLFIATLIGESPLKLFAGLGAMAAVLMFVFKDPILGFLASIQLAANKMVKPGDWISLPQFNADGTVEDISLTSVKVQNWDKTITTIPTYELVSGAMTNWIGMEESGGRRIKRSINVDMRSVTFCSDEMLERFSKFALIRDYVVKKQKEIDDFNVANGLTADDIVSSRRQTNLGVFRKYLEAYLHSNPQIHDSMTFLVRHLQPTEKGLPIEIYVFSNDQRWANYEAIQADIFDHILAVLPQFGLSVFQNPTGEDVRMLVQNG